MNILFGGFFAKFFGTGIFMKILSIGNSFSQDAQKWLHQLAISAGCELFCANLYIGGCSLERHSRNYESGEAAYDYEINGEFVQKISLPEALVKEKWDVITLQQVSGFSGIFASFEPYLSKLSAAVREKCPNARIFLHKTWAYENGSGHPDFANYGCSQKRMFEEISKAYNEAVEKTGLDIIPTGDAIQYLRENIKEFDVNRGGIALTRDSFHLSFDYGRFAAGLVWLKALTGINAKAVSFIPCIDGASADSAVLDVIKAAVDEMPQIRQLYI